MSTYERPTFSKGPMHDVTKLHHVKDPLTVQWTLT